MARRSPSQSWLVCLHDHEPWIIAGALWAITWAVFGLLAVSFVGRKATTGLATWSAFISVATVALAVVVASICVARWHHFGETVDLRMAVAVVMFGALRVGFSEVLTATGPRNTGPVVLSALGLLATFAFLGHRPGRSKTRHGRAVGLAYMAGLAAAVALVIAFPSVGDVLIGRRPPNANGLAVFASQLAVAGVWLRLARDYGHSSHARARVPDLWFALMLVGLAQSRLALGLNMSGPLWLMCGRLLRLEAVLMVVIGLHNEVQHRLVQSEGAVHRLLTERRAAEAEMAERRHDVTSALFSVASTVELLERHQDALHGTDLASLSRALQQEISRLNQLVGEHGPEESREFELDPLISSLIIGARAAGQWIEVDLEPGLTAYGRPNDVAEALRNVLDNTRVHAPGAPVAVLGRLHHDRVVLTIADLGPGIGPRDRTTIFQRGHRGRDVPAPGSGLGLYLAAQLLSAQGGEIDLDPTSDRGASFRITLPSGGGVPGATAGSMRTEVVA